MLKKRKQDEGRHEEDLVQWSEKPAVFYTISDEVSGSVSAISRNEEDGTDPSDELLDDEIIDRILDMEEEEDDDDDFSLLDDPLEDGWE